MIEHPVLQIAVVATGHGILIVIEGLVVFVQTTRLILFEFFTRFLRADGRLFRPFNAPNRSMPPTGLRPRATRMVVRNNGMTHMHALGNDLIPATPTPSIRLILP